MNAPVKIDIVKDANSTSSIAKDLGRPSAAEAESAVRTLIEWAGDDPDREGLLGTPERVVRAYREFFRGYDEDPVEIRIAGVTQVQVQEARGLTYAAALRSLLRQDPQVLMEFLFGEARRGNVTPLAVFDLGSTKLRRKFTRLQRSGDKFYVDGDAGSGSV